MGDSTCSRVTAVGDQGKAIPKSSSLDVYFEKKSVSASPQHRLVVTFDDYEKHGIFNGIENKVKDRSHYCQSDGQSVLTIGEGMVLSLLDNDNELQTALEMSRADIELQKAIKK
eukprot:2284953-Ditylum_brightwellii.AAC.1